MESRTNKSQEVAFAHNRDLVAAIAKKSIVERSVEIQLLTDSNCFNAAGSVMGGWQAKF